MLISLLIRLCLTALVVALAQAPRASEPAVQPEATAEPLQEDPLDFARDVRPILSDKCFQCHGPDEASRATDLRFDQRESVFADLGGYAAVTPGDAEASEAVRRVFSDDEYERMPPPDANKSLSLSEAKVLRRWVEQGAKWSGHWAFTAPVRPTVPEPPSTAPSGWSDNPIDAFVLRRLQASGLEPSAAADRETLLRRIYLDLIGLPPTLAQRETFLNDTRPNAYERLVETLLASPHYGERWGQKWLDAARYADSDGYEKDKRRPNWFYRDWVVDALNDDKPYDWFVVEQVAGDLLPGAGQDELVATGFLRNSMVNEEGGVDPEQFRAEATFDRIDAIGKSVLGLTTQCAQCHTHKFDPIKHTEYFGLYAYLNSFDEAIVAVYSDDEQRRIDAIHHRVDAIEGELQANAPDWRERLVAWAQQQRQNAVEWKPVRVERENFTGEKFEYLDDLSVLSRGFNPTKETADMAAQPPAGRYTSVRVEFLTHPTLPRGGPGRSIYGTHALTEFRCFYTSPDGERTKLKLASASSDIDLPDQAMEPPFIDTQKKHDDRRLGPIEYAIDEDLRTGWHTNSTVADRNRDHKAVFVLAEPIDVAEGGTLTFRLKQDHGGWNPGDNQSNTAGRYRFSVTEEQEPTADPLPSDVRDAVNRSPDSWSETDWQNLFAYWRTTQTEWDEANDQIASLRADYPAGTLQCVVAERDTPRVTRLYERGEFTTPGEVVEPHTPAFLPPTPAGAPPNRLTLARWLTSRDSPTTARTQVNRVWQAYFGTGLVETPEDLGSQSQPPSHPELLDWLAVEFMDSGWRLKPLHRLIVTSAAYRQSSVTTPVLLERDPKNRLLARATRLRVDAEAVRDVALAASGLLDPQVGGPPVYPPVPAFLFERPASFSPKPWNLTSGPERYRRSLYVQKYRTTPYPAFQMFDAPTGSSACVRRYRSSTPLQALTLLNETQFVEAARALGQRLIEHAETDADRLEMAFLLTVGREPAPDEVETLAAYLAVVRGRLANGEVDIAALVGLPPEDDALGSDAPSDEQAAAQQELAAWTLLARCVLNLDETITRQ